MPNGTIRDRFKRWAMALGAMCAIGLHACAWETSMQKALQPYQGKNIKAVIARIGYPDSQDTMLGKHVYVWNLKNSTWATCKINVATDASDTITDFSFVGDRRGCGVYEDKLEENN
jgi:hypothetical protein